MCAKEEFIYRIVYSPQINQSSDRSNSDPPKIVSNSIIWICECDFIWNKIIDNAVKGP